MICEHVRDSLSAYLDNQLTEMERQNVASHLALCSECSTILADYRRFDALLAHLPRVAAPAALDRTLFPEHQSPFFHAHQGVSSRVFPDVYARASAWPHLLLQPVSPGQSGSEAVSSLSHATPFPHTSRLQPLHSTPSILNLARSLFTSHRYTLIALLMIFLLLMNKYVKRYTMVHRSTRSKTPYV